MLYKVCLPRRRCFVALAVATGFAGAFMSGCYLWYNTIFGINAMFGPAGILTLLMMTTPNGNIVLASTIYVIGCGFAIIIGLLITLFAYSRITIIGTRKMKILYSKNSTYQLWQQILLSISFVKIIAVLIYWICAYYQLSLTKRQEIARMKVT